MSWTAPRPLHELPAFQLLSDFHKREQPKYNSSGINAALMIYMLISMPFLLIFRFDRRQAALWLSSKGPNEAAQYDLIPDAQLDERTLARALHKLSARGLVAHQRGKGLIAQFRNRVAAVDPCFISVNPDNAKIIWELLNLPAPVPHERLIIRNDIGAVLADAMDKALDSDTVALQPLRQKILDGLALSGLASIPRESDVLEGYV